MALTRVDKSNLARFGCAFSARENLVLISWPEEKHTSVVTANILASLVYAQCTSGPLLCVAFEISPSKALPHYCFLPLDVTDEKHKQYLALISKESKIRLRFLAGSQRVARTHEIPPSHCTKMSEICRNALTDLERVPHQPYDFERAVTEFEQSIRLPDQFEYVLTESELRQAMIVCKEKAAAVTPDARAHANSLANELLDVFRPHYKDLSQGFIDDIPMLRRSVLFGLDLRNYFGDDHEAFVQFLSDAIAVHVPPGVHPQVREQALVLKAMLTMMANTKEATEDEEQGGSLGPDLLGALTRIAGGRALSIKSITTLLPSIGIPVGGEPGRTPKDYSREYELRSAGRKWRVVAEFNLENDPDTRKEFGGRKYNELSRQEQATLMHRVREGIRSFAKRTGKAFPSSPVQKVSS
jgi:hypothetical protein